MRISQLLVTIAAPALALASSQAPLQDSSTSGFKRYQSQVSPNHAIRVKRQNSTLCETHVDQYTGWLDVGHKHLFFWYFKSESAAAEQAVDAEPLGLWYEACSSSQLKFLSSFSSMYQTSVLA